MHDVIAGNGITTIRIPHHMMTSSNGKIFRVTGPLRGEITGHRWIHQVKAGDTELWYFFDLRLNKRLSKQSWGWWFEMPSRSLWRHCNIGASSPFKSRQISGAILWKCLLAEEVNDCRNHRWTAVIHQYRVCLLSDFDRRHKPSKK